jgi:hypothetical protein
MDFLLHWLDLLWLPLIFPLVAKRHRVKAAAFILACILTLRLQVELMDEIGYTHGFLPFLHSHVLTRGYIVYGLFIGFFLVTSYFSKGTNNWVYLAGAIGMYILGFAVSTGIMLL